MEKKSNYTVNWVESENIEMNWCEPENLSIPEKTLKKEELLKQILEGMKKLELMEQNWVIHMIKQITNAQRNKRILQLEDELNYIKSTIK